MVAQSIENADLLDKGYLQGTTVLEFGAGWCSYCQAAQRIIIVALAQFPAVKHIKIEDGKGQRLGRSYRVKLWPTLIFLQDGLEIKRLVRPVETSAIVEALNTCDQSQSIEPQP